MREMEQMPMDNVKKKKILIDEEEPQDTINNQNTQIGNQKTNDIALNVIDFSIPKDSNYFLASFNSNFYPNIILLLALFFSIILELIFKDALFKYSLTYEQNLQNSLSKGVIEFFNIISITGNGLFVAFGLIFILCYFPLIKLVLICFGLTFMVYLTDIIKLLYNDARPFWLNTILFQGKCETSYGNPSGHSLIAFYFYLSFAYYLCKNNFMKYNKSIKIGIYITAFILSVLTAFSRLVLGVHSLDQVIYGSFLGIFAFHIFAFVFRIYDMPLNHYLKLYRNKRYINVFILSNIIMVIFPFILYAFIDIKKDKAKFDLAIDKKCPGIEEYKLYSKNCLAESLIILLFGGIYLGQFVFWFLIDKKKNQLIEENRENPNFNKNDELILEDSINHWNDQLKKVFKNFMVIIKVFCIIIIALIPGIFYLIISGDKSFGSILLFKIGLPLFFIGFLALGPCLYGIINELKE